jgi:hypothetical protein
MELIPIFVIVYGAIVLYDINQGQSAWMALVWPLQSVGKIFAWVGKQDPALANQMTTLEAQVAALQAQLAAALQNKINPPTPPATK